MRVFVYGTLKRGFGNNPVLRDAKFIKEDMLSDAMLMLDAGFPVILPARGDNRAKFITGEVFELPDNEHGMEILRGLDRLEGEGNMYHRKVTTTKSGEMVSVYIGGKGWSASRADDCLASGRITATEEEYTYVG